MLSHLRSNITLQQLSRLQLWFLGSQPDATEVEVLKPSTETVVVRDIDKWQYQSHCIGGGSHQRSPV